MRAEMYTGGARLPSRRWGWIHATIPFARLTIRDDGVSVRITVGRFDDGELALGFGDIKVAYPLRGRVLASGVGFNLRDGRSAYFYTSRKGGAKVLSTLRRRGVIIDEKPRSLYRQMFGLTAK
jgi:hypothetical protein